MSIVSQPASRPVDIANPVFARWADRISFRGLDARPLLKNLLLIPLFPALGYFGLDRTGFSTWLVTQGVLPQQVLGEGFGHVGLCVSLHYVLAALRETGRLFRAMSRVPLN